MRLRFHAPQASRLDKAIADNSKLSRKRAKSLIAAGGVKVDGAVQTRESFAVPQGAVIEVRNTPHKDKAPELPVRFQDDLVLVVDKPSGLPTQATRHGDKTHLYAALQAGRAYVGLHHRLDTPASGLVLVTVSPAANKAIAEAFQGGRVEREYLAVVVGDPGPEAVWDTPIDGERARTVVTRVASGDGLSVLRCRLDTGRTHQIRIHAAQAGHPLAGDRRHGGAAGRLWPRIALHACRLVFPHPKTGEATEVLSPVPEDLAPLVERAGG